MSANSRRRRQARTDILFVSSMDGSAWGGSEELWSQTALRLAEQGLQIAASIYQWASRPSRIADLVAQGVSLRERAIRPGLAFRLALRLRRLQNGWLPAQTQADIERFRPRLVVLSSGDVLPPIELMELCYRLRVPFVTIGHTNYEGWWPYDAAAERIRVSLLHAQKCYFICNANRRLVEGRLGLDLENGCVVHNPYNISFDEHIPWPCLTEDTELRLACVGRLEPSTKGQDLLLEALSAKRWAERNWHLNLYGDGPTKAGLQRYVDRLGLEKRVTFCGFESPRRIWQHNHVLVLPSRYEGLPLVVVEAMLCGRPVVATDVGGVSELVHDGVNGFIAESASADSIRVSLERAWKSRASLRDLGRQGRKDIRDKVPPDPPGAFAQELINTLGASDTKLF